MKQIKLGTFSPKNILYIIYAILILLCTFAYVRLTY